MKNRPVSVFFFLIFLLFPSYPLLASGELGEYDPNSAKGVTVIKKRSIKPHKNLCQRDPFVMYPGSLKGNIERMASDHCWHVVKWNVESDFNWAGSQRGTVIRAASLQEALRKVLDKYPLQAQFYLGNHVLAIEPRTLK